MRRRKQGQHDTDQRNAAPWLVTFNDVMTLLMTFFVMVFAMSSLDFMKMKSFTGALQSALGVLEEGTMTSVALVDSLEDLAAQGGWNVDGEEERESIGAAITDLDAEVGVSVQMSDRGALITLKDTVLFGSGRAEISADAFPLLDKIAFILKRSSFPISVEGHTDNVPISTGRFPSNWELSVARAVIVVRHLCEKGGMPPQRLSAAGYGESKPLVPNDTPEHRASNRRVEIILIKEGEKLDG